MPDAAFYVSICTFLLVKQEQQRLRLRYLYFCTSTASKLSTLFEGFDDNASHVSICTFCTKASKLSTLLEGFDENAFCFDQRLGEPACM